MKPQQLHDIKVIWDLNYWLDCKAMCDFNMTSSARMKIISLFLKVAGTFKKAGSRASSAICKDGGLRLVVDMAGYVEIRNSLNCNPVDKTDFIFCDSVCE